MKFFINPLSANFTKWSSRLKQFVSKFPTNCFSVFGYFVGLALKGLRIFFVNVTNSEENCGFVLILLKKSSMENLENFVQFCVPNGKQFECNK